jgi:5-(carboxyamino)imidazole ribonucleotide synthase
LQQTLAEVKAQFVFGATFEQRMIKPFNKRIGVIGGGQLGKMLIESSSSWNVYFHILDPSESAPAKHGANEFIQGSLMSEEHILKLSQNIDVLTYEIEHVNVEALKTCESRGVKVLPSSDVLELIQDKGRQKRFYAENNIQTTPFVWVEQAEDWIKALDQLKGDKLVAKSRKGGYDGKGVEILSRQSLASGQRPFPGPSILEEYVEDAIELSVIAAVDQHGNTVAYPPVQMHFDPESNLVDYLYSPASVPNNIQELAKSMALKTVSKLGSPGLYAVELFVNKEQEIFVNEVAPRPHNSGHHTIEAFYCSQYEMLLRILCDLPLGSTAQNRPAVMVNLVGPENVNGRYVLDGAKECLNIEGVYIHLYNKEKSSPNRKLGHVTCVAESLEEAVKKSLFVKEHLKIKALT